MQRDRVVCKATRKDGQPCTSRMVRATGYCTSHDPDYRDELRRVQAAGGHAKSRSARAEKLVPGTLRPVLQQLLAAMAKIETGQLDSRQATALAAVAGAIVRVYTAGTLEERVQALEDARQE